MKTSMVRALLGITLVAATAFATGSPVFAACPGEETDADGRIKPAGGQYVGDGAHDSEVQFSIEEGASAEFVVRYRNRLDRNKRIILESGDQGVAVDYRVKYFLAGANVTAAIAEGLQFGPIAPGKSTQALTMRIKHIRSAGSSGSFTAFVDGEYKNGQACNADRVGATNGNI
jgi:hypothetical protein